MPIPFVGQAGIGEAIVSAGLARVRLTPVQQRQLDHCRWELTGFFNLPAEQKAKHTSPDQNFGYRPPGKEYAETPDRPDTNECFTLWSNRLDLIPNSSDLAPLLGPMLALRAVLKELTEAALEQVALAVGADPAVVPTFAAASHIQANYYRQAPRNREFMQDAHEDGHMVTWLHTREPGLEVRVADRGWVPVVTKPDEILVMPSSILTLLTGGDVQPLYHRVRNLGLPYRQSLMYFVNPDLTRPLLPWTDDSDEDLRDAVRARPTEFGLPEVPVL